MALKIDLYNAFNGVSRQCVLEMCKEHFPELLSWSLGATESTHSYGTLLVHY